MSLIDRIFRDHSRVTEWETRETAFDLWQYCSDCREILNGWPSPNRLPSPSQFKVCPKCGNMKLDNISAKIRYRFQQRGKYEYRTEFIEWIRP